MPVRLKLLGAAFGRQSHKQILNVEKRNVQKPVSELGSAILVAVHYANFHRSFVVL